MNGDDEYNYDVANSNLYKGALADCFRSLLYSVSYSEADKSVSALSSEDKKNVLALANSLYSSIGEATLVENKPKVHIGY